MPESSGLRDRLQSTLGDTYAIEAELPAGGMARVFVASDRALGRRVVIKTLPSDAVAALSLERFRREVRLTASLQQANIVPVLSAGDVDGLPYYTMPLVEGASVRDALAARGPLPISEAISILRDIARALAYAHDHGVVHRDIKPENVLLSGTTAVVTDFGIAKAVELSRTKATVATLTQFGTALGTPAYMSPEQASGDSNVDHRADIYALGLIGYELLTGGPPFAHGAPQKLLAAHIVERPAPIGEKRSDVPAWLNALIMRCLEKDPAHRPQGAEQILQAFDFQTLAGPPACGVTQSNPLPSLVVLPFANMSPDPDAEYFSDGLTEEIVTDLSSVRSLRVLARSATTRLKNSDKTAQEVGRELGVQYVVRGGVRRDSGNLRITAQLIDAASDIQIWADKFMGTTAEVFEVQERVSRAITHALGVRLSPVDDNRLGVRSVRDPRVYDLYLRARAELWTWSARDADRALQFISQARAIEPDNAALLGVEAMALCIILVNGSTDLSLRDRAVGCAARALALEPDSIHGHYATGWLAFERGDLQRAATHFKAMLARESNNGDAWSGLTITYIYAGKQDASRVTCDLFRANDPLHPYAGALSGAIEWFEGRFDKSIDTLRTAVEGHPRGVIPRWNYCYALALGGRLADSAVQLAQLQQADAASPYTAHMEGILDALSGRPDMARQRLERTRSMRLDGHLSFHLAEVYALAECRDDALQLLKHALENGFYANSRFMAEYCPFLRSLRQDPRFPPILHEAQRLSDAFVL